MGRNYITDFFQCRSLVAAHYQDDDNHLARRIPGLGVSVLENGALYWGRGNNRTVIEAPAVYWVWEGKYCDYGAIPGRKWDNAFVHIVGDVVRDFVDAGLFPVSDRPFVALPSDSVIFDLWHKMYDLYCQDQVKNKDTCIWYVLGIGLELKKILGEQEYAGRLSGDLTKLKSDIFAEPLKEYDFDAIAARFRISRKYFDKKFTEVNKLPPHNTIVHARLQLGMKLLLENNSVKESAEMAGFSSASYFSRIFKKYYDVSPKDILHKTH